MSLHPTQIELIEVLKNNSEEPLSMQELMDILKLSSKGLVHHHITQLEKKGYLKRNPSNPRDYKILLDPERPISYLNLYGMAKCGEGQSIVSQNPIDRIPVASKLISFSASEAFMVVADGDSMEPNILHKDLVIVQKQNALQLNEIIVCTYMNQPKIKFLRKIEEILLLESLNRTYPPIIIENPNEFAQEGVVRGLIRR